MGKAARTRTLVLHNHTAMPRILVIDDDPDIRELLAQTFTQAGHETVLASDGREGVRLNRARPADLVITDLFMPNQEGLETIIQLRKEFPRIPVIAMSGKHTATAMLSVAEQLGAVAVLEKPFLPDQLLQAAERALRARVGC